MKKFYLLLCCFFLLTSCGGTSENVKEKPLPVQTKAQKGTKDQKATKANNPKQTKRGLKEEAKFQKWLVAAEKGLDQAYASREKAKKVELKAAWLDHTDAGRMAKWTTFATANPEKVFVTQKGKKDVLFSEYLKTRKQK